MSKVIFPRRVTHVTTAGAPRDQWLTARRAGLGGSDIAAILGTSPHRTAIDVWMDKTGRHDGGQPTPRMRWGSLLEDTIATEWARRDECRIRRCGMVADPAHPWRLASLDRAILVPGTMRAASLLEVKTTTERWASDVGDDGLAAAYQAQTQWYLGITGLEWAHVAVLIGGQELRELRIQFDIDVWHTLCETAARFWADHVIADVCPPVEWRDASTLNRWPAQGGAILADGDVLDLLRLRDLVRAELRDLEADADLLDAAIKAQLGAATDLVDAAGRTVATWRPQSTTRVDVAALKDAGVYEQFASVSTTRVLRVRKGWDA